MKAVVAAFNQEKALVGAFSVITKLRICFGWNFLKHYSRIVWDPSPLARHWAISSMFKSKNMNITLTSSFRPNTRYPMGLHRWQVIGDRHDCEYVSLTGPGDVDLHFSACSQDDFSCEDGSCVSIQKRCDRINDCGDSRLRGIQ